MITQKYQKTKCVSSFQRKSCFHLFPHSDLKQVLVWEIVSGVDLEDEDMIDSGLSPSVSVDAQQEEELDQQEATPIDPHQGPHVLHADEHSTW